MEDPDAKLGHGSPVVAEERVFTLSEPGWKNDWPVLTCIDTATGKVLWEREVNHLPAFEAAVREGGVAAIMTAYNLINGVHCAEHHHLLRDILKGEWGFDGLVMSDWVSVYDAVNTATACLDLEMPVAKWLSAEHLLPAIRDGRLNETVIDDKIRRLLRMAVAFGWMDHEQQDRNIPLHDEANAAVALEVARESIVLLANDGILPLDVRQYRRIAVIGPCGHPEIEKLLLAVADANPNTVVVLTGGGNIDMRGWHNRSSFNCYHDHDEDLRVALTDGVFGGYRHFDLTGVAPRYPFGFGLSFTTFSFERMNVHRMPGDTLSVEVSFDLVNTGKVAGKTVAQVYVGEKKPRAPRPVKELKGFAKVALAPGERRRVSVALDRRAFSFFDVATNSWAVRTGVFTVSVATSATDIKLTGDVNIEE